MQLCHILYKYDVWSVTTLHVCARGKVIGRIVVVVIIVDTKITKSGDLGTWPSRKHNEYVEFGEKLASVCSELSGTAYKSCI